jgi:hypothetical protein
LESRRDAPRPGAGDPRRAQRVELTAEGAVLAIRRAAQLVGWDDHGEHLLFVYALLDG